MPLTVTLVLESFPVASHANLNLCKRFLSQAIAIISYMASPEPLRTALESMQIDLQYLMGDSYYHFISVTSSGGAAAGMLRVLCDEIWARALYGIWIYGSR